MSEGRTIGDDGQVPWIETLARIKREYRTHKSAALKAAAEKTRGQSPENTPETITPYDPEFTALNAEDLIV